MLRPYAALLILFACIGQLLGQTPPNIEWSLTLGGPGYELGSYILPTSDGGYLVTGSTSAAGGDVENYHGGPYDAWVVKLDHTGMVGWKRTYGGAGYDVMGTAIEDASGNFYMVGSTTSNNGDVSGNHGGADGWMIKLDGDGNLLWQHCHGGSGNDYLNSLVQLDDGGFIVAGTTRSTDGDVSGNHGTNDYWLMRLNAQGEIQWQQCFGGSWSDDLGRMVRATDGSYLLIGTSGSFDGQVTSPHGGDDVWVVNVDSEGVLLWEQSFGGAMDDVGSTAVADDTGFCAIGWTSSQNGDFSCNHGLSDWYVFKADPVGNTEWQETCLGGSQSENALGGTRTVEGGYLVPGSTFSDDGDVAFNHGDLDAWLVRLDSTGNILWQRTYGGSNWDAFYDVIRTVDGGYLMAGSTRSNNGDITVNKGLSDMWVMKLGPDNVGIREEAAPALLQLAPNPATDAVELTFSIDASCTVQAQLYDESGRYVSTLMEGPMAPGQHCTGCSLAGLPAGVYALHFTAGTKHFTQRLVKL